MTAALEGGEWSAARPGRTLPPGKNRYPFYRRLGGPQGQSGRAENLVPTEIRSRTVRPVVSRYTEWSTRHTITEQESLFNYLGNMISYAGELDIDNKLIKFLKITGILNNVFRPQKKNPLRKQE